MSSELLSLKPVSTKLNGLVCVEIFDKTKLELLLKSNLLIREEKYDELLLLKKYKKNEGRVEYIRKTDFGRVFAEHACGLHMIRREIRHCIAGEYYVDIDIINCQPTILNQVLLLANKEFVSLNSYVINRAKHLEEIQVTYNVDRDSAKHLINRVIFSGSFSKWAKHHNATTLEKLPFIKELEKEVKQISAFILENNPLILRQCIEKQKKDVSNDNKVLSIYLQEIENRILETI